jgi:hypothetical protein
MKGMVSSVNSWSSYPAGDVWPNFLTFSPGAKITLPPDVAPIHIAEADKKYHLGVSDLTRIQVVKVGWMDSKLV